MPRGEVVNLKVYQRVVDDGEVMNKYNAVGLSEKILLGLQHNGINLIRIVRVSSNHSTRVYYTSVGAFLSSDLKHFYIKDDLNLFVPFSKMIVQSQTRQARLIP